jgi:hypothetical protein
LREVCFVEPGPHFCVAEVDLDEVVVAAVGVECACALGWLGSVVSGGNTNIDGRVVEWADHI